MTTNIAATMAPEMKARMGINSADMREIQWGERRAQDAVVALRCSVQWITNPRP